MQESVFGSMSPVVDDKLRIIYQQDFEPGLAVRGMKIWLIITILYI